MASLFSEALDFALPIAGKDSDFKLKTEQKLIIEAVVEFFTPFARTVTFLNNFQQIFVRRIWSYFDLSNFSAFQQGSPLSRAFRNY